MITAASYEKLGFPARSRVALRRTNMRLAPPFVKRVNTTNCALVLGQSQDVDACADLWKTREWREGGQVAASRGAQAGCSAGCFSSRRVREERGCRAKEQGGCHDDA